MARHPAPYGGLIAFTGGLIGLQGSLQFGTNQFSGTELSDKAESLRQASEAKRRFLSAVSHELRTPLNAISSLSRLLLDRMDGDLTPEQAKQIHFVLRSADGLSEMVTELLDLAKIEAGKTELKPASLPVGEIFSALRGMFRPLSLNDRVKLIFADGLSNCLIRTD